MRLPVEPTNSGEPPEITVVLGDAALPGSKRVFVFALSRDPVDAANDAEVLAKLLERRCHDILSGHHAP